MIGQTNAGIGAGRGQITLVIMNFPPRRLSSLVIAALFLAFALIGAAYPAQTTSQPRNNHWAFQPIRGPVIPTVRNKGWVKTPIDQFILAGLEGKGLRPAPPADRRTLIRRLTYDLIGLPPTPAEVEAFLADKSPDAYEKVVDRLLTSPHYGERWARRWLDLVRYAETDGHEFDADKPGAFEYRDYVIRAFNADVPYKEFVMEHIAGDLIPHPRRDPHQGINESIIGTGFWWLGEADHSPVDVRQNECDRFANQVDVFSKCFLGLSVGCARCHNHKFDPISTNEYYALAGYLRSSRYDLADINPSKKRSDLVERLEQIEPQLHAISCQMVGTELAKRVRDIPRDGLQSWLTEANIGSESPLLPLLKVASAPLAECEAERARQIAELRARAAKENSARRNCLADFAVNDYRGWFVTGDAFGSEPTRAGVAHIDESPRANMEFRITPPCADSRSISPILEGKLRSPTFTIEKPWILYRMAGRDTQANLIIDGFQRIRDPIYGGLTIRPNSGERFQWYSQNVSKWIGQRAYVEFTDHGPGFISVDRIQFSETSSPPPHANGVVLKILEDRNKATPGEFYEAYAGQIRETAKALRENRLSMLPDRDDRIELANAVLQLQAPSISASLTEAADESLKALLNERLEVIIKMPRPRRVMAMADGTGEDLRVDIRGNYRTPGDAAPRRLLSVCYPGSQSSPAQGSGRLELAQRLVSPSNPLLTRVIVNRMWQYHFGEGIVRTPDDFGIMGQRPTNQQLLDWLATEFSGSWSLKRLHKLMVMSTAYQMSSRAERSADAADPQNRLLHKMPVRRLEAECVRDAMVAVSGRLDRKMFGPSIPPHLTPFMEGRGRPEVSGPLDGNGRRSIYLNVRRNFMSPMALSFDYPVPATCMGRRSVSNVPSQALTLMNDPFMVEQARVWAKRALADSGLSPAQRIEKMYLTALSRPPTVKETEGARAFLTAQARRYGSEGEQRAWTDLCHVLFNVKEFVFVN